MSKIHFLTRFHAKLTATAILAFAMACASEFAFAQQTAGNGVPVHMVVTVEPRHGSDIPLIHPEDVMVFEGRDRDKVTEWVPAQGDHAALELFILLDDGSSTFLGNQMDAIRQFIDAQPNSALVGVAYMQNGTAKIAQNPTSDHALAAKALRLPLGIRGENASPYFSLSDLIKRWPATAARRSVLVVTNGVDPYYRSGNPDNPYLDATIDDAIRAGITVSVIYNPGAGRSGRRGSQTFGGQNYLSRLADETGGGSYYMGFTGSAVSFSPYLDDLGRRLNNQFLLTFLAKTPKKAGWQNVRVKTEVSNARLVSANRVYVSPPSP